MNTIWIVLPILTLLMFELGLTLNLDDFKLFLQRPRPVVAGLIGQIVLLPLIAFACAWLFKLDALFFVGVMLIACSPGGSSSNVFSMLAKGDVALSVSLTALSSIITLFTIPIIMQATAMWLGNTGAPIHLPVGNLIGQNLLLMLLPIAAGVAVRRLWKAAAAKIEAVLARIAFPALIFLAAVFFIQHHETIAREFGNLGGCIACLILLAMGGGFVLSRLMRLNGKEQRTIIIEVGMQNAAQGIAVACSPFIFGNEVIAIPSIIYALLMNVILLIYVGIMKRKSV